MRIGLLGPAEGNLQLLREAAEFLLGKCGVNQVVYLGSDDAVRTVVEGWAEQIMGGAASEDSFLDDALQLALAGDAASIRSLLARDKDVRNLAALRCLPPPPARAV